ncbi:MAG: dihydroorotase [Rhodospirillales bacterium]|nr:dihydroorotase [Rhodospirillales bacterium]
MTQADTETTIIRNGRVIDPATGHDAIVDIVVQGDRIVAVGAEAGAIYPQGNVHDAAGCLVTPGLIDIHTHCFVGLGDFCLPADMMGVRSGVPIIVDAGTAGATIIGLARRAVIDHPATETKVFALMDPAQIYLANKGFICHYLNIAADERNLDLDVAREALDDNREIIVGFKVRATYTDDPKRSPFLAAAMLLAPELPVMVHFGEFPHTPVIDTDTLLAALRPGDIITHAYRGGGGQLDAKGEPTATFRAAFERGVRLDVGHSGGDFHFPTARRLIERGFTPNTISTDLNVFNVEGPVYSMSTTMSKIWVLGIPLADVIRMNTVNAAAAIRKSDDYGTLAVGRSAEISILRIETGRFALTDGHNTIKTDRRLRAVGCFRGGRYFEATHDREPLAEAAE